MSWNQLRVFTSAFRSGSTISKASEANKCYKPDIRPVAVFLGGTSGIGRAMAEQLARQTNGRAHIIIMGRNKDAAEAIITSLPKTSPSTPPKEASEYSFIKVDATSMTEVREVAAQLKSQLLKINFIITTPGVTNLKGRDETSEGIDRKMACFFYARYRFIHDLAPLVERAADNGEHTAIASILAAGTGSAVDLNDLGLVKGYSLMTFRRHLVTYTDCVMQVSHQTIDLSF
jgi:NAD(P)-dependent dehydrogenase (short-subunit alcohol dehydrogenase family)